ncbi:MAG: hypothetical protein LUE99_00510 [Bacteroides sp.]|nr:hypothetical protein [Bacteroides sp.]
MDNRIMEDSFSRDGIQLPQAIDVEKALLGTLMVESHAYWQIYDLLHSTMFYSEQHQLIYVVIEQLSEINSYIDAVVVLDYLKK